MACMGQCTWVWSESMGSWMPGYYNTCESGCICGPSPGQEGPYDGYVATVACESTGGTTTTTTTTPSACASSQCCWLAVRIETGGGSGYMAWAPSSFCPNGCACSVGFPPYTGTDPAPGDVYCAPCVEAATTTTSTTAGSTTTTTTTPYTCMGYCSWTWSSGGMGVEPYWFYMGEFCGGEAGCVCPTGPTSPGTYNGEVRNLPCLFDVAPTTTTAGTFTTTTTTEATTTTTTTEGTTTTTTTEGTTTTTTTEATTTTTTTEATTTTTTTEGTTTTTSTEGPLGPNSYNCFSDHNNPTGDVPPPDYKVYLCDWKGTPPQTFSGTWYCTNGSPSVCPTYPTTPTAVTFTRQPCTLAYSAPEGSIVPFRMNIPDPMLPSWENAHNQALAIGLTGFLPAHPTGTPSPACTCGTGTIFLSYEFTVELCHFHIEITAVTF